MKHANFRWAKRMPLQAALLLCAASAAVTARAGVIDDWNLTTTNVVLAGKERPRARISPTSTPRCMTQAIPVADDSSLTP